MLPKRGDIVKIDQPVQALPVYSSGGGLLKDGEAQTFLEGTLLRYLRTTGSSVVVQPINPPKVRRMLKIVNPDTNNRQTYLLDAYSVSFYCKREELNWNKNESQNSH